MSTSFRDLALTEDLQQVLAQLGYSTPTAIQEKAIPEALAGKDLLGQSSTGSGKTLAFVLPILQKIDPSILEPQALILCPTRELAAQVARDCRRLARAKPGLQVLMLVGGEPARPQTESLSQGVPLIVGTPGRVLDHLVKGRLRLENLKTLVLDEADRMLDMGFEEQVFSILEQCPASCQSLFFSATFPETLAKWSRRDQRSPVFVRIDSEKEAPPQIEEVMLSAEASEKSRLALRLLQTLPGTALVFCNQKSTTAELQEFLASHGLRAGALHGDLEQFARDQVLAMFRNGSYRVLVATDVAARGLDIANLDLVLCFDVPYEAEVYTHRIGRTGRAGQSGLAISLAGSSERQRLIEFSMRQEKKIELLSLDQIQRLRPKVEDSLPWQGTRTLMISGGRKDKLRPGDILGAFTGEAGRLQASDIGQIEIHDQYSYVAVIPSLAEVAVQRLKQGRIKGRRFLVKLLD